MKSIVSKKILLSLLVVLVSFGLVGYLINSVNAEEPPKGLKDATKNITETADKSGYNISNKEIEPIIGTIIKSLLSFLGVIFFILTLYGGFLWMTSRGNADQVGKAKDIIITAIIGLAVVLFAYAITYLVVSAITDVTGYSA